MSISRLENGRYRAKFKMGRQQISSKTFDRMREARTWLDAQKALHADGFDSRAGKRTTVEDALQQFLVEREGRVAESTLARDKSVLGKLSNAILKRPVGELSGVELERFLKRIDGTAGNRERAKTTLAAVFSWTVRKGYRKDNPVQGIKLASGSARAMSPISIEDIEDIAEMIEQPEYRRLIRVLAYTGLRWGEARALKVGDVYGGRLHVTLSWSEGCSEKDVKQHQGRWVPILDAIADDIDAAIGDRDRDERLFLSPMGRPINSRNLRRSINWSKLAPGYRLHDLRHSAITAWVEQGVELATVQRWAGHQSLKTTNRYVHATDRAECAAVTLLNEAWKGSGGGPRAAE